MDERRKRPSVAPSGTIPKEPDSIFTKKAPEPIPAVRVAGNRAALLMPIISVERPERRTVQEFIVPLDTPLADKEQGILPQGSKSTEVILAEFLPLAPLVPATPILHQELPQLEKKYEPGFVAVLREGNENQGAVLLYKPEFYNRPTNELKKPATGLRGVFEDILLVLKEKTSFIKKWHRYFADKWQSHFDKKMGL